MKNIEIHQFDPVIYPFKIWVTINKTPDFLSDRFKEYDGSEIIFTESDGTHKLQAFVMQVISKETKEYGAVLFFRSKNSMDCGLIAHESSHAAKFLFEHINADIREHEPFEYVLEFIVNCCYKVKINKF